MLSQFTLKKSLFWLSMLAFFGLAFTTSIIIRIPIEHLNQHLAKNQIKLINLSGDWSQGQFSNISISGQIYPLNCQYKRQKGLNYTLECQSPFKLSAQLHLGWLGTVYLQQANITGELVDASTWMTLADIPSGISGQINLTITDTVFNQHRAGQINSLKIDGNFSNIHFYDQLIFKNIDIYSQQNNPIIIDTVANEDIRLFLETTIENGQYLTKGEIQGKGLNIYAPLLNLFGRQTSYDTFQVYMAGQLL